jgi:hypothetical protein
VAAWVIAGYARTPPPPDPGTGRQWGHAWTQRFHDHAAACGHVLGPVRVDAGHDLDGFHDLLARARHGQIVAVLVPGLDHLHAVPALAGADPDTIRRYLRARIRADASTHGTRSPRTQPPGPGHRRDLRRQPGRPPLPGQLGLISPSPTTRRIAALPQLFGDRPWRGAAAACGDDPGLGGRTCRPAPSTGTG